MAHCVKFTIYFPTHILPVADIKYLMCSSDFYKVSLVRSSMLFCPQFWKGKKKKNHTLKCVQRLFHPTRERFHSIKTGLRRIANQVTKSNLIYCVEIWSEAPNQCPIFQCDDYTATLFSTEINPVTTHQRWINGIKHLLLYQQPPYHVLSSNYLNWHGQKEIQRKTIITFQVLPKASFCFWK